MADPRDFLLNTDYEMDKIVYFVSGEVMPTGNTMIYIEDYDLGFIPLIFATFSFSEDFSDTRMDHMLNYDNNSPTITIEALIDGIMLQYTNDSSPNQKLYYRIYGFEPSDSTANVPSTQDKAKEFILNTDYNYCKLYKKGVTSSNKTIDHNLGYTPFVLAWEEGKLGNDSIILPCWSSNSGTNPTIRTTTTSVIISDIPAGEKVHYRIYYDEV